MLFLLYFSVFLIAGASAALPACNAGITSPPGGIWSEWATTSTCSSSCGSCSKIFYTRKCVSERAGYPCTGDSTRHYPCGTSQCVYPAQRTCCIPFVPMLINGTLQCGPLPKESSSTTSCCPVGGLWTTWTTFARNANTSTWQRTRECVSEEAGCPCQGSGLQEQTQCPCPVTLDKADCPSTGTDPGNRNSPVMHRNLVVNDNACTATVLLDAHNEEKTMCFGQNYVAHIPLIKFELPAIQNLPTCRGDRPFNCDDATKNAQGYSHMTVSFTCDLETRYWRYDYTGWLVTGYVQFDQN